MAGKATYEESKLQIKELNNEILATKSLEKDLERMFNFSLDMIGSGNLQGYFIKVNSSFGETLGYSEEEFLNKPFLSFVHREDIEKTAKALADAGKGKRTIFIENRYKCKDGPYKWIEWKVQTLLEENKFIAVGRDITDRKRVEEDLKKHRNHLEQLVAERTKDLQKANEGLRAEISERKLAEEAILESEREYRSLFNSLPDPVIIIKEDFNVEVNTACAQLFGYSKKELDKGLIFFEEIIEKDIRIVRQRIETRFLGKKVIPNLYSFDIVSKEGRHIPCESRATLIQYKGKPAILAVLRDATERKEAQEKLEKSEEQLRLAMEATQDGLWDWKINEKSLLFSSRLKNMLGYEEDEEIPTLMNYWVSRVHPDHLDRFKEFEENLKETKSFSVDFLLRTKNGEYRWFNSRSIVLYHGKGTPYRLVGSLRDIDKEKQSEELIRRLTQSLITSQESERQMISRELHDSVAQDLSSAKIASEVLLKYKSLTPGARKKISEISGNLHNTLKNVRDLSYELRPPGLEKLGLTHTMHILCKDFSNKTGVRVDFQSAGIDNINLSYETKINLYRLLQEGLNNVKKHADASNVKVRLVSSFPNLILRINDDGKGFDLKERLAKTSSEKRMGLRSMEERVSLLHGKIKIESIPGKGTKVVVEIPHKEDNIGV